MKKYKTIIISDVHLSTIDCKAKELVDFLDNNSCEKLILNGDIVDGWAMQRGSKLSKSHSKVIRKIFKLSEHKTEIIWIRGNHDDFIKELIPFTIGNIQILDSTELKTVEGKRFFVCHGDVFDVITTKFGWIAKIGSVAYDLALFINRVYNKYRKLRNKPYYSISKIMKDNVKAATSFIGKFEVYLINYAKNGGYDGVICGHIHQPDIKLINDIIYMNSGDWVENMSALVENHDGTFEIVYFIK